MSDVLSATPVVSRARSLAAIYVPAHCEPPAEELESSAQLVVGADPKPMVRIVPPSRRTRAAMPATQDRVVLALAAELIKEHGAGLYAQEACDPYLFGIGHSIYCGFRAGRQPPPEYLEGLAPAIAEHLSTHYPVRARRRDRHGLAPSRLWRALALIEEKFAEPLPVEDLAEAVHLSPFHFARMFRRSTGMSPHAFITRRRLDKAKLLLATTGEPIAEIARDVGYRTQAHFTRVFHSTEGVTPRRYRREHGPGGGSAA